MSTPLVKSLFWLTFAEILFNVSGYVIHAVAGRFLGPADYGRYSLVITLTTMVIILIGNGIPTSMSRYLSEVFESAPEKVFNIKRTAIRLQVILMGSVTIIFFLLAPVIAWLLRDPTLTPLFQLSSLIIPAFAASSFYFYYFTGLHLFNYQSALKIFRSFLRIFGTVSLLILFHIKGAIAGYILAPLGTFLLGIYFDRRTTRDRELRITNYELREANFPWRKLLCYAWPLTLFLLFYEVFISLDLYLVKALLQNDAATGLYNAALTLGRLPYYLFYALSIVLLPALAKMSAEKNTREMKTLMTQSLRYAGIILLPLFILMAQYAEPLIDLFFGHRFIEAAPTLQVLVCGLSWLTVFYLIASALNGIGRATVSMWLAIGGTFLTASLTYSLVLEYGILGAAVATSISALITTVAALVISQRYIPITFHWGGIFKTFVAAVFLWVITGWFPANDWLFIPYGIFLSLLYFFILYCLRVLHQEDITRFTRAFHKSKV